VILIPYEPISSSTEDKLGFAWTDGPVPNKLFGELKLSRRRKASCFQNGNHPGGIRVNEDHSFNWYVLTKILSKALAELFSMSFRRLWEVNLRQFTNQLRNEKN